MKVINVNLPRFVANRLAGFDERPPRICRLGLDGSFIEQLQGFVDDGMGLPVDGLLALGAEVPLRRHGRLTPRARRGRNSGRFVFGDVGTVDLRDLAVGVLTEDLDVAGGRVAATHPAVMVLDVDLRDVPSGEVGRRGLPEVRQRDGLVDVRAVGHALELLADETVRDAVGSPELGPDRCVGILAGVIAKPLGDGLDARHQEHASSALLAIDGDLQAVLVVLNVPALESLELAATEARVELEGDHRSVPRVRCRLQHRFDVVFPQEDVSGVRRLIVVIRIRRRNPLDGGRRLGAVVHDGAEAVQNRAHVPVGLLVAVSRVDERLQVLGGGAVFEGVGEPAAFFGHDDERAQELPLAVLPDILRYHRVDATVERAEDRPVGVADLVVVDAVDEVGNLAVEIILGIHGPMGTAHQQKAMALDNRMRAKGRLQPDSPKPNGGVAA